MDESDACFRVSAQTLLCISGNKEVKFHRSQNSFLQLLHLILQFLGPLELGVLSCFDFVLWYFCLTYSSHLKIWAYSLPIKDWTFRFCRKNLHCLFMATAPMSLFDCLLTHCSYLPISPSVLSPLGLSVRTLQRSYSRPRRHRQTNVRTRKQ